MFSTTAILAMGLLALGAGAAAARLWTTVRRRGLHRWGPTYFATLRRRPPVDWERDELDIFLAVCDHFEPEWGAPSREEAVRRVRQWVREYPERFDAFRDADGRCPQHTFFFPQDQYQPEYLDALAELCALGFGDVDVHLHHDRDTPDGLREKLEGFRRTLSDGHGLLRRDPITNEIVYGFIHGNWCLCNSRPDGRWCGVDHELPILLETGCYADFTMPSAPSDTQIRTINSIYYASDTPRGRGAHAYGPQAAVGKAPPPKSLLMIQGPLLFDARRRVGGVLPRVENGDLLGNHPPTLDRFRLWVRAHVSVSGRPDWRFVKLHTHGCKPSNTAMLLGEPMVRFHRDLAEFMRRHPNLRLHYVTAWEMAQKVHEAESGATSRAKDRLFYV
jgi:hypothetical protein